MASLRQQTFKGPSAPWALQVLMKQRSAFYTPYACQILFQIGGCIKCFVFEGRVASILYWWSPSGAWGSLGSSGNSTAILSHVCMCLVFLLSFLAACFWWFRLRLVTFLLQSPCTLSAHTPPHCPVLSLLRASNVSDRWWLPLLPETTQIRRQV